MLDKLKAYCHGNKDKNFGLENVQLQTQLRREYPVVTKIIMNIEKKRSGMLLVCVGLLLGSIIQHTLDFYRSLNNDNQSEYIPRTNELNSEIFPQRKLNLISQNMTTIANHKIRKHGRIFAKNVFLPISD